MKKTVLLSVLSSLLITGCASYYSVLQKADKYEVTGEDLGYTYTIDKTRAAEIRNYFSENTDLDLNRIYESGGTTWEKTLEIATFVSRNIGHNNQTAPVTENDAIYLWKYHLNIEKDFNCKYHSILTAELLLSAGITSRYVWCMPKSSKDSDCHVVNHVWIPELSKWVMIDTDQRTYVCDKDSNLLSIPEIREKLIAKEYMQVSSFAQMYQSTSEYLDYLSKDFYWFVTPLKTRFVMEKNNEDPNNYVNLLPKGFSGFRIEEDEIITHDNVAFWKDAE